MFKKCCLLLIALFCFTFGFYLLKPNGITAYAAETDYDPIPLLTKNIEEEHSLVEKASDTQISKNAPMITFLTHGLGGNASHWSNKKITDGEDTTRVFAYQGDSLIEKLRKKASDADVYLAKFAFMDKFELYLCPKYSKDGVVYETQNLTKVEKLTDLKKQIIVVCEFRNTQRNIKDENLSRKDTNLNIYRQFHYLVDSLLNDVASINNGIYPKINLIGHSRGGLTNLEYAIEHYKFVDSVFSLGTPYVSSVSAEIVTTPGENYGQSDIVTPSIYSNLYWKWHNNYNKLKNIKVYALGGYSSLDFVNFTLAAYQGKSNFFKNKEDALENVKKIFTLANAALKYTPIKLITIMPEKDFIAMLKKLDDKVTDFQAKAIRKLLNNIGYENEWQFWLRRHVFFNDVFVDLDSQLGKGKVIQYTGIDSDGNYIFPDNADNYKYVDAEFDGFIKNTKKFTIFNTSFNNISGEDIEIVHNLEAQDSELNKYILTNIDVGEDKKDYYETKYNSEHQFEILTALQRNTDTLDLTKTGLDKPIESIGEDAFANNSYGMNYTKVIIPASVKRIEDGAFENCSMIKEVVFQANSELQYIGARAFAGCSDITSISIPNNVIRIGTEAFAGTSLKSVSLGNCVDFVGISCFGNNSELTGISVDAGNSNFCALNGNLYSKKNGVVYSLYQYVPENNEKTFVMPETVERIETCSFTGAENLVSVDLKNVKIIDQAAFSGCKSLTNISGDLVEYVDGEAFFETPFYDKDADILKLGKVLLKYNIDNPYISETVGPDIMSIATNAILDNTEIKKVFIPVKVNIFCTNAVYNCPNLKEIVFYGKPIIHNDAIVNASDELKITVPYNLYSQFEAEEYLEGFNLQTKKVKIGFDTQGGTPCEDITVLFGQSLPKLPASAKEGYKFSGWYSGPEDGAEEYATGYYWGEYEDSFLYAKYDQEVYYDIFYTLSGGQNNPDNPDKYKVSDEDILLKEPTKENYIFRGWFEDEEYTKPITKIDKGRSGAIALYAKWEKKKQLTFIVPDVKTWTVYLESGLKYTLPEFNYNGKKVEYWNNQNYLPNQVITVNEDLSFTARMKVMSIKETGYKIYLIDQLKEFRDLVNGGNTFSGISINLMENIEMTDSDWTPISGFSGTFYGNGYTINNLKIIVPPTDSALTAVGLFGVNNGKIENLSIENAYLYGDSHHNQTWVNVGIVCGTNNGTISNITACGTVNIHRVKSRCGGITGYNNGTIKNCSFGKSSAEQSMLKGNGDMGGIAGDNPGNVSNCVIDNVLFKVYTIYYNRSIGGFVGYNNGGKVIYCELKNLTFEIYGYSSIKKMCPAMGFAVGNLCDNSTLYDITITGDTPTYTYGDLKGIDESTYFAKLDGLCGAVGKNVILAHS